MPPIKIRQETPADWQAITDVTVAAFAGHPHSQQTEQFIVRELRAAGALTLSQVAEEGGQVVGHVAFSPVTVSDGSVGWFGVGPLSVRPDCQRKGLGSALLRAGLDRLKQTGGQGCVLVGELAYYRRFGFRNEAGLVFEGVPAEYFMALAFGGRLPVGRVEFHKAFFVTS